MFASPTGYVLTSSGFPLLNWGMFYTKQSLLLLVLLRLVSILHIIFGVLWHFMSLR